MDTTRGMLSQNNENVILLEPSGGKRELRVRRGTGTSFFITFKRGTYA
jgi:hypothetical protein